MSSSAKKKSKAPVQAIDTGPAERRQHNKVVVEQDVHHRARLRIVDQLEIDRLMLERLITIDQHTAGEHLYRLITAAGYFPAVKWAMESNIRGDVQSISQSRANAIAKVGLAKVWLNAKSGEATTRFLWTVVLGERKCPDKALPALRHSLDAYHGFESWWHGRDVRKPIPSLLADMPRRVQAHRPRSFHHEV